MPKKQGNIIEPSRFINPFTDFGFKKIFGEEPNKDLLIDFLNAILEEQKIHIHDLTYKKTDKLGASDIDRRVVFDLYCENDKGEKFIVEMQKAKQTFFKDRTVYYSTFPIQEQAIKGAEWNYELKAVYAIAVLDFSFDDEDKDKPIVYRVQLLDTQTKELFYDKLTYIFIQIPKFSKNIEELETKLDKWLYVLKHLEKFERIPEKIKDKIFQKLFNLAEYHNLSSTERQAYEDSLKYYRDLKNSLETAENEGFEKAESIMRPLIEQAQAIAEKERQEKEEAKTKLIESARVMKSNGIPIDVIAQATGLTKEEIEKL